MGIPQDLPAAGPAVDSDASPLSKRRRFTPQTLPPIIPVSDNTHIEHHTFDSPLLLQLCEQAPDRAEIEAGLLQVGMRVRKSVAEGYKTQPKKFTPRPFFNPGRLSPETQAAITAGNVGTTNELAPYAAAQVQPLSTATFCGISLAFLSNYPDDWSDPKVAQQSLWTYSTSHKRGYELDSDSDESQDWQPQTPYAPDAMDAALNLPLPLPLDYFTVDTDAMSDVAGPLAAQMAGRRIILPKTRTRPVIPTPELQPPMPPTAHVNPFATVSLIPPTQEPAVGAAPHGHKRMVSCGIEAMDFSDAAFLQRREDVEMDCS